VSLPAERLTLLVYVAFGLIFALLLAVGPDAGRAEGKKGALPGEATWDLAPLERLFRVVKTDYDEGKRQVIWTVQTREAMRTADFVRGIDRERPFVFLFYDAEMKELARVDLRAEDFKGIPKARLMKSGTRLEVALVVPKVMPKVKKVVLRRGRVE
jgi:hypothetical protein